MQASSLPNIKLRHGNLAAFFGTFKADIICLQEAKVPKAKLTRELACVEGYESFWSISREKQGYSGATTYAASKLSPTAAYVDCLGDGEDDIDREGRMVMTEHGGEFTLINVYVPNAPTANCVGGAGKERPRLAYKLRFLHALLGKMDQLVASGKQVICCGDFNISVAQIDVHSSIPHDEEDEEHVLMRKIVSRYPDAWRLLHPLEEAAYTCWDEKTSGRAFNIGARIDYFLVSPGLLGRVVGCSIIMDIPHKWSDHAAVVLQLSGVAPIPPHPPCALSSRCNKAFNDPAQGSIARMFAAGTKRAHSQTLSGPTPVQQTPASAATTVATQPVQPRQQHPQQTDTTAVPMILLHASMHASPAKPDGVVTCKSAEFGGAEHGPVAQAPTDRQLHVLPTNQPSCNHLSPLPVTLMHPSRSSRSMRLHDHKWRAGITTGVKERWRQVLAPLHVRSLLWSSHSKRTGVGQHLRSQRHVLDPCCKHVNLLDPQ
ncbi:MAG: hypothetical protein WDW38_007619 [Sanguina aurantia]